MFWQDQQGQKAPLQTPARPASDMWDRDGALNKGVEDDAENPALNRKRRPSSGGSRGGAASPDGAAGADAPAPGCDFYKKGWFWAIVVVVSIICIAAPVGVATQKKIDEKGMNPNALTPKSASGTYEKWSAGGGAGAGGALLFDPVSGTFSAGNGNRTVDVSKLTCADLRADVPPTQTPEGKPPVAVTSAAELQPATLAGATWPGYDDGASTFLSGLSTGSGWASGDLASAAYSLRSAGARAVRLPFAFTDLFTIPPRAAAHRCGAPAPGAKELADAAQAPAKDAAAAALVRPVATGNAAAFCNAYVPAASLGGASSTLTRFLYTVQTLVESGHYVVLAYAPPSGGGGEAVVEAPESLAASWGRLWAALSCLPGYEERLAGRVLAEPLATPKSHGIGWGKDAAAGANGTAASAASAPLGEYYSAAADAIEARTAKGGQGPVYVLAGTPAQASSFAGSKPYGKRVVSAAELYSGAAAKTAAWQGKTELPGARPWTADAAEKASGGKKDGGSKKGEEAPEEEVAGAAAAGGQPAPGTVAAARAAARAAAAAGAVEIETGRRRLLL
jgi:hypothetical protein